MRRGVPTVAFHSTLSMVVPLAVVLAVGLAFGQGREAQSPVLKLEISRTQVPLDLGLSVRDAEAEFLVDLDP